MQGGVRYGELTFDPSFLFARHGADEELKFTRSERALLLAFTRHPRVVLTRNQLLDAIAGAGDGHPHGSGAAPCLHMVDEPR